MAGPALLGGWGSPRNTPLLPTTGLSGSEKLHPREPLSSRRTFGPLQLVCAQLLPSAFRPSRLPQDTFPDCPPGPRLRAVTHGPRGSLPPGTEGAETPKIPRGARAPPHHIPAPSPAHTEAWLGVRCAVPASPLPAPTPERSAGSGGGQSSWTLHFCDVLAR